MMRLSTLAFLCVVGLFSCSQDSPPAESASSSNSTAQLEQPVVAEPPAAEPVAAADTGNPVVMIETSMGTITAELWADKAPLTVENFLRYAETNFYDGLVFHRVIDGFMIQGGGYAAELVEKPTFDPIKNEARTDTPNNRGTLAMARTNVVDSATSQFFINLVDNSFLNHADETPQGFGYAVFGEVTDGMDIVDSIAKVPTGAGRFGHQNVPVEPVVITSIRRQQ